MAARPKAETGVEILYARVAGCEELVALVVEDRAIEGWRLDRGRHWRWPDRSLRQRGVAEPSRPLFHQWRDNQRPKRWNDDRGRRRLERRGWAGETEGGGGLGIFKKISGVRGAGRERVPAWHTCGGARTHNPPPQPPTHRG